MTIALIKTQMEKVVVAVSREGAALFHVNCQLSLMLLRMFELIF